VQRQVLSQFVKLLIQPAVFLTCLLKRLNVSERLTLAGEYFAKPLMEGFTRRSVRPWRTRKQVLQFGEIVLTLREFTTGGLDDEITSLHSPIKPWYHRFERLMILAGEERGPTAEQLVQ
jgi:hypothetical protein